MIRTKNTHWLILITLIILLLPFFTLQAVESTPDSGKESIPFTPNLPIGNFKECTFIEGVPNDCLGEYIKAWYGFVVGTIGILATIMIMYAGFKYLTSRGDTKAISDAKDIIISALSGIAIAFLSYTILYIINPNLVVIRMPGLNSMKFAAPAWTYSPQSDTSASSCNNQDSNIGGYDFSRYATSCSHVSRVRSIYDQMAGQINNASDAQKFIDQFSDNSPITGEMVMNTANKYNIDPAVLIAEMTQDSSLGTAGRGSRSNNPGNIANADNEPDTRSGCERSGGTVCSSEGKVNCCFSSWQAGVDATGSWLSRHKS